MHKNKVLIIVDPLKGFVDKGPLANPGLMKQIPYIVKLIKDRSFEHIALLCDTHQEDDPEFKFLPQHCLDGTEQSQIVDEINKAINNILPSNYKTKEFTDIYDYTIYEKNWYSARICRDNMFFEDWLYLLDSTNSIDEVHITGFVSSICVYNAIQDMRSCRGVDKIIVHKGGIGDIPEEHGGIPEKILFNHWKKVYNAEVI